MRRKPSTHCLRLALLIAAALGAVSPAAQGAPPASVATSDKPGAATWAAMDIEDLRQRANAGETAAMEELGRRLLAGTGVPRDAQGGASWYRRAADGGSPTAAFTMGVLYEGGVAVERNSAIAVEWYDKAVAGDVAAAKHNLALMLREGRGAPQDGPRAVELLRAAARQGMTASTFMLGDMYERGSSVPKDPAAALAWFAITVELELHSHSGNETPLSRDAQARGQAIQQRISAADRERADKIGQEEFRQIIEALNAKPPPPDPAPPAQPAPAAAAKQAPVPPPPPAAAAAAPAPPAAATEEPLPDWPRSTVDQVKAIQQALIDLKLLKGKVDGSAGKATRAAIRDFEKSASLPETGQPSREVFVALAKARTKPSPPPAPAPAPASAPTPDPAPPPSATASGAWPTNGPDQIRAIQRLLVELKLLNAEPTGTVGPLTKRAILEFERNTGQPETGEPSEALFNALKIVRAKSGG